MWVRYGMYALLKIYQFCFERIYIVLLYRPPVLNIMLSTPNTGKVVSVRFSKVFEKKNKMRTFIEKDCPTAFDAVVSTGH